MPAEVWVPIVVVLISSGLLYYGNSQNRRDERLATAQQTSQETLDKSWEVRLATKDEQIESLRAEVARLTQIIEQRGGHP